MDFISVYSFSEDFYDCLISDSCHVHDFVAVDLFLRVPYLEDLFFLQYRFERISFTMILNLQAYLGTGSKYVSCSTNILTAP